MGVKTTVKRIMYKLLPQKYYLKFLYRYLIGKKLNLKNPKRFSEKIFWLKIYNGKYLGKEINSLHDKYEVRKYVEELLGKEYLSNIYGVYDNIEEINFDDLPNQFVLKLTKMSGMNIVCKDKNDFDRNKTKELFNKWINVPLEYQNYSEEAYTYSGKPRIICEELLFSDQEKPPLEYQVLCFNGKAKLVIVDDAVVDETGQLEGFVRNTFDMKWNLIPVNITRERGKTNDIPKPNNLEEIVKISEKLSKPFPFVRVDLYNIDDKIIFRELTWIPMGGNINIEPKEYDDLWGEWLDLPEVNLF